MKKPLTLLATFVALLSACPSPPATECDDNKQCVPGRCVVVDQIGHCEGATAGTGEGEGDVAAEGEGDAAEGEGDVVAGEGEGDVAGEGEGDAAGEGEGDAGGEGEGEGDVVVDRTLHFERGVFVGGDAPLRSAHFSLLGAFSSSRRQ